MNIKGSYNCLECIENYYSNNLLFATGDKMGAI